MVIPPDTRSTRLFESVVLLSELLWLLVHTITPWCGEYHQSNLHNHTQ